MPVQIHSRLGPSSAHRWIACPGSVKAEEGLPNKSTFNASEGVAAHELAELCLLSGDNCSEWIGKTLPEQNAFTVDQEMASNVQMYVDYVRALKGDQAYEQQVKLDDWVQGCFGTSDAIVVNEPVLSVVDLKYGKGVPVKAENNEQGMMYALGAYALYSGIYDIQTVRIVIHQPRLDSVSEWELSVTDLLKWAEFMREQAQLALSDDAPLKAGEKQCQWCKAKAQCPELMRVTEQTLMVQFDSIDDVASPDKLTDEQMALALKNKTLIESWLSAIESNVTERLASGQAFKGYKLVEGRSLRDWSDSELAEKALKDLLEDKAYTPRKLISPAQAEKELGKEKAKAIQSLIIKPKGKPTLAEESDKRPSINISVDDF